jgi:hypothetical protein
MKERLAALFIGLIMIMSIAGFAAVQLIPDRGGEEAPPIPTVIDRQLTSEEIVSILRTGRVLIQNHYLPNCTECADGTATMELFANKMSGFVVLESAEANDTKMQMISPDGRIKGLEDIIITEDGLMDMFCDISILQPRECLLREIED